MKTGKECPFCQSDINKYIFDETEHFMAIYNKAPILPGHSMVAPKRHVVSLLELSNEEFAGFFRFAGKITRELLKTFHTDAFNWSIQESEQAGQTVAHLHLHIIVRQPSDLNKPGDWYAMLNPGQGQNIDSASREEIGDKELQAVLGRIRNHV